MYETPLVQLQPEGEWSADMDALVVYTQLRPFPSSSWDWIGLYRVSSTLLSTSSECTFVSISGELGSKAERLAVS